MPRNGSGVYSLPPGSTFVPNTLAQSSVVNGINNDLATDLNTPRPIVAGGTGATTVAGAQSALGLQIGVTIPTSGYIYGLTTSNNAVDATNSLDIAVGLAANDALSPSIMILSAIISKSVAAGWTVGGIPATPVGGLDTGTVVSTGTYHVFLIQRSDTGVVDALFSTSATAPTMPASYDRKRRIGSFVRAGGVNKPFIQDGDDFSFGTTSIDISAVNPTAVAVTRTVNVPLGIRVEAKLKVGVQNTGVAGEVYAMVSDLSITDQTPSRAISDIGGAFSNTGGLIASRTNKRVRTNTSAQVRSRCSFSDGTTTLFVYSDGWIDTRGRT